MSLFAIATALIVPYTTAAPGLVVRSPLTGLHDAPLFGLLYTRCVPAIIVFGLRGLNVYGVFQLNRSVDTQPVEVENDVPLFVERRMPLLSQLYCHSA